MLVIDDLFIIVGFNVIDFKWSGVNNIVDIDNSESEFSFYLGVIYLVSDIVNVYVSYLDVY